MKKLVIIGLFLLSLATACNKGGKKEAAREESIFQVEQLVATAAEKIDQEVTVEGFVTHTCKHSGRRCFIVGEDANQPIRVEAKEITEGFKADLVGSKIIVKGIVREQRISADKIAEQEKELTKELAEEKEDGDAEHCQAQMQNVQKMKDWMTANNKDYYPIYYVDGTSYTVAEEKEE